MKKYKHWVSFDTMDIEKVRWFLERGSKFSISNIYASQSRLCVYVLEIESTDNYDNLDLSVNDGYNILHRFGRKPSLGEPITNKFIEVYGTLPKIA